MKISVVAESMLGTREEQQDAYLYRVTDEITMAVVCDGMGGLNGGTRASQMAARTFKEDVQKALPIEDYTEFLRQEAATLDSLVFYLEDEKGDRLQAGTTLVALLIVGNLCYFLTVGDSRLFMQRGQGMIPVNREHNYKLQLEDYRKNGIISDTEYNSELREQGEALISYLGMGNISIMDVNRNPILLQDGDRFLLCSDGLTKIYSDEEIKRFFLSEQNIKKLSTKIKHQIAEKHIRSQDNTTYIILQVEGGNENAE
jgi:serine/threonine protein phosphatase PrpC